jgi:hypothetical protein
MYVWIILFDLKLFKNKKENIACWREPHVDKLSAHPCLYTVIQSSSTVLKEAVRRSIGVDNTRKILFRFASDSELRIGYGDVKHLSN